MRSVRVLLGVFAAGLAWSGPAGAGAVFADWQPTEFFGPVDLTDTTPRQVYYQTESTPCQASNRYGPDGRKNTADDFGQPGQPAVATSEFQLDPGCALTAADPAAQFQVDLTLNDLPGLPPGTDFSNGFVANLTFEAGGATAVVTVPKAVWGPTVKNTVDTPGLVTVDVASISDNVFKIDVASGDVLSYSWSGNANTVLGPAVLGIALLGGLPGECDGTNCGFYSAEASDAPGASGATNWACGTGGFLAQPNNTPGADPGSFGTCGANGVPGGANPSPGATNAPYDPTDGTFYANARSVVLNVTPKAWAPLDGRLSEVPEPAHLLMLCAGVATLALTGRRRRSA